LVTFDTSQVASNLKLQKTLALVLVIFDTSQVAQNTLKSSNHALVLVALTQAK
jgi:hypothetical protein